MSKTQKVFYDYLCPCSLITQLSNDYTKLMHYNGKIMGSSLNQIMRVDNLILILYFTSIEFHTHG